MTPYPDEFPKEALELLLDGIRGIMPAPDKLIHACWCVAGFALGKVMGGGPIVVGDASDEEVVLQALQHGDGNQSYQGIFPWILLLKIALKQLSKLLENV